MHGRAALRATRAEAQHTEIGEFGLVALLAAVAQSACEALGDDAVERRSDEERLDVHLGETGDRARRVVGVQRREHEVAGERGLDGDLRRLVVTDLAEQHDVRVGPQDASAARSRR